jgi:hypothetical protein
MTPTRPLNQPEPDLPESHPPTTAVGKSDIRVRTGDSAATTLAVASILTAHGFSVASWAVVDGPVDLFLVTFSPPAPMTDATRYALQAQTPILFIGLNRPGFPGDRFS